MESQARGGTRWKRFGAVMVPSVAATAAIGVALAQGALAASLSISGQEFKVKADKLEGDGFAQWGSLVQPHGHTPQPVGVSSFNSADIYNMCQSVVVPTPIGDVTLRLEAGGDPDNPVHAENLFLDVSSLDADAEFTNIDIGVNAADVSKAPGPEDPAAVDGMFAQQATAATLTNVKQTAWSTTAGSFRLSGLSMRLHMGNDNQCF